MNPAKNMTGIAAGLLLGIVGQPAAAQGEVPRFEPEPCETFELFQDGPDAVEGTDVECSYLLVPQQRIEPATPLSWVSSS